MRARAFARACARSRVRARVRVCVRAWRTAPSARGARVPEEILAPVARAARGSVLPAGLNVGPGGALCVYTSAAVDRTAYPPKLASQRSSAVARPAEPPRATTARKLSGKPNLRGRGAATGGGARRGGDAVEEAHLLAGRHRRSVVLQTGQCHAGPVPGQCRASASADRWYCRARTRAVLCVCLFAGRRGPSRCGLSWVCVRARPRASSVRACVRA